MEQRFGNTTDFNPYFGTDYGICSIIKPQLTFNKSLDEVPYWHKIFGPHNWDIPKGAEVGKANGLSMLLDAETFDYTFHLKAGEGQYQYRIPLARPTYKLICFIQRQGPTGIF